MKKIITSFFLAFQFFTTLPFPFKINYDKVVLARGFIFSPLIGLIIGALLSALILLVEPLGNKWITCAFLLFFNVLITGGLHLDGAADTLDGLCGGMSKKKFF